MKINIQAELAAAKLHLDRAIQASDTHHLSKLGAARYEIVETMIRMHKEAESNAPTSCVS
ncbi:hypothetical protein NST50_05145 [Paenibacillus sp. FSL E2-0202]|uniref:hypothetical protein n=1 Tax=Paenibacillus sp. FSL E2-0202 TaxID=2954505 RepID=UPI0030EC6BBC